LTLERTSILVQEAVVCHDVDEFEAMLLAHLDYTVC
jgi:hypothetical protein